MRIHLLPSSDVTASFQLLDSLATNIHGEAQPAWARTYEEKRNAYVAWARSCESQLLSVVERSDVLPIFENPRHLEICTMDLGSQILLLISSEVASRPPACAQSSRSSALPGRDWTALRGVLVYSTQMFLMQCLLPNQIRLGDIIGEAIRLMVPLRVLEELDQKKYGPNLRLRKVSRDVLSWVEGLFTGSSTGPMSVGDPMSATIELLDAERPRHKPEDPDEEILDVAHEVKRFTGRVKVVTADTCMRLRARSEGLDVASVPSSYLRIKDEATTNNQE